MLKIDESLLKGTAQEMERFSRKMNSNIDQMFSVASYLSQNESLEAERVRLKKALRRAEEIQYQLAALSRTLDSAAFDYAKCEKDVVTHCDLLVPNKPNTSRLHPVEIIIPYTEKFKWKLGGK